MLLIPRYIIRSHIAPFIFGTAVVMFLFLLQFILLKLNELVGKGLSPWIITQLITYNLAHMLVLAVPMGILFATLMAFGSMAAAQEVTIYKASGSGLLRMMFPVIIFGIILSGGLFWFFNQVVSDANHESKILMGDIIRKKPTFNIEAGQYSTQLVGYTILARSVDSSNGLLRGVTIYDRSNGIKNNVISADSGTIRFTEDMNNVVIMLLHGEIHQLFADQQSAYRKIGFSAHKILIPSSGFSLERSSEGSVSRGDREMTIRDMQVIVDEAERQKSVASRQSDSVLNIHCNYLFHGSGKGVSSPDTISLAQAGERIPGVISLMRSQVESSGYTYSDGDSRSRQYMVEIHKKYAIPFACFVFVFIGCPLGIMTKGGNFGISAAISLLFYVIYWAFLMAGEKLADRQIAPPSAMWLGNIVIGILGIILTMRTNNESLSLFSFAGKLLNKVKSFFAKEIEAR